MKTYNYDVAFTFLYEDQTLACQVNELLEDRFKTFIYFEKPDESVSKDIEKKLNLIYRKDARIIVIFYRHNWGEKGLTAIARKAIKNRAFLGDDNYNFILLVNLEDFSPQISWIPTTSIFANINEYGVNSLVAAIENKIMKNGGKAHNTPVIPEPVEEAEDIVATDYTEDTEDTAYMEDMEYTEDTDDTEDTEDTEYMEDMEYAENVEETEEPEETESKSMADLFDEPDLLKMEFQKLCEAIEDSMEILSENNEQYKSEITIIDNTLRIKCNGLVFYCMLLSGPKFTQRRSFVKIGITDNVSFLSSQIFKEFYERVYTFNQNLLGWNEHKNFYTSQHLAEMSIKNFIMLLDIEISKREKNK